MNTKRITLFAGHYGSGKTNIAVNYALWLKEENDKVVIADLDSAICLFEAVSSDYTRESKLAVDANVAKLLLAYAYLQAGGYDVYETENGNCNNSGNNIIHSNNELYQM